jgi:hypothetical protein
LNLTIGATIQHISIAVHQRAGRETRSLTLGKSSLSKLARPAQNSDLRQQKKHRACTR